MMLISPKVIYNQPYNDNDMLALLDKHEEISPNYTKKYLNLILNIVQDNLADDTIITYGDLESISLLFKLAFINDTRMEIFYNSVFKELVSSYIYQPTHSLKNKLKFAIKYTS
jgi:hypothetical protein